MVSGETTRCKDVETCQKTEVGLDKRKLEGQDHCNIKSSSVFAEIKKSDQFIAYIFAGLTNIKVESHTNNYKSITIKSQVYCHDAAYSCAASSPQPLAQQLNLNRQHASV